MSINDAPEEFKNAICTIKADIKGKTYDFVLNEDLSINYEDIEMELDRFPQIYHLWTMIYSELKEQVNMLDKQIRRRRGILTNEILNNGGKSLRRGDISDLLECDDELAKLEAKHIIAQKKAGKLYHTLESLRMKNDNIRSLSGFKKVEMQ